MRLWSRKNTARVLKPTWLEIPDVLLNQLTWWYKTPERLFKESEYVFVIQHRKHAGQPYKERRWFMKSLCKRASVKYFPLGDMRPIVASHLYDKGKPTKTIQGQLRHARPSTTDRYLKTITGSNPGMGDTLENLWDTPGTEYDSEYDFPLEEG
jgi:integrase